MLRTGAGRWVGVVVGAILVVAAIPAATTAATATLVRIVDATATLHVGATGYRPPR